VRHKHAAFGHLDHLAGHLVEARRIGHHVVGDARELRNEGRNGPARIHERGVGINHPLAVVHENGEFRDAVVGGLAAGGFKVNNGVQGRREC
jgi:hypothetical protein